MEANVRFIWQEQSFLGWIEKEYEHSFLINVLEPACQELTDKFANRIIISKKHCQLLAQ